MVEQIENMEKELTEEIGILDEQLYKKYENVINTDINLTRQLVSFQANKKVPYYRWYKYKEGFSNDLVNYYIRYNGIKNTKNIFDPFAGSGTALFTSSECGINSCGIELLPIGTEIIETRKTLMSNFDSNDFDRIKYYQNKMPWFFHNGRKSFIELKITQGAFPDETKKLIEQYLDIIETENKNVQKVLKFALLCILESISYTRKDGQYLRWDYRSGRKAGSKPFNKGEIKNFNDAITEKLTAMIEDVLKPSEPAVFSESEKKVQPGLIEVISGSSLEKLPTIKENQFDFVITSPPYANRYDYTRTYALELAMLGVSANDLLKMRQTMLSCTVENKEKDLLNMNYKWREVISILEQQELLQKIISFLEYKKSNKTLNNNGIPRMVKGYFYELSCVIFELYRVLRHNGAVIMVNDNVRYAGVCISVDLILSNIASEIGFQIEKISILPNGKGNSSQQMGIHGRKPLRKCVYIWRKK